MQLLKRAVMPFLLTITLLFGQVGANAETIPTENGVPIDLAFLKTSAKPNASQEMRGLWVASVLNIDYPTKPTTNVQTLKTEALAALDYAQKTGFNAVFLQVRPTADAFYKSDIFPWSKYLTGTQGKAPEGGFDPLTFWIAEAHARGLELHAWINPYRITKKTSAEPKQTVALLAANHPARLHPDWVVTHEGNLYFNPGIPEARKLIVSSVQEILNKYAVDGIHFDDYFYPGDTFADAATYQQYGQNFTNVADWRRENVNQLVKEVADLVRTTKPNVRFGISPFGIWLNKASNSAGSDTNGLESYKSHAADTVKWVKNGWVDYITPQIYWQIGYSIADYSKLLKWWSNVVKGTSVDLYVGQAAYRMDAGDSKSAWYGVSELSRQLAANQADSVVKGSLFYNYTSLKKSPALSAALKATFEAQDLTDTGIVTSPTKVALPNTGETNRALGVARPTKDLSTSYSTHYLTGYSDPSQPLYLNGVEVPNRSAKGYYGVFVPLTAGKNTFVFSQKGVFATRSIYRTTSSASSPVAMKAAEIVATSVYPQSEVFGLSGDTLKLSCTAPIGAKVTALINGTTITLTPATTKSPGKGIFPTTYSASWKIPVQTGTARVVDLGKVTYTMVYAKKTASVSSPAKIGVVMPGAPFIAETKKDASVFDAANTDGGTRHILAKGAKEAIISVYGAYAKLASGYYINKSDITMKQENSMPTGTALTASYAIEATNEVLTLKTGIPVGATVGFDGQVFSLYLPLLSSGALPGLPSGALFRSVVTEKTPTALVYRFTLAEGVQLDGYLPTFSGTDISIRFKRHIPGIGGNMPLTGKTILLDPGHGGIDDGGDTGAIGPLGTLWSEKHINLSNAFALKAALEQKGATVLMTRSTDVAMSLEQRLAYSKQVQPDLFISLHADSMSDNVDISKINGFSVFYREALAKPFATLLHGKVITELSRKDRRVNERNFYVIRGTWAPSILLEAGFVPNPTEYEWLTDPNEQKKFADTLASAVVAWFEK